MRSKYLPWIGGAGLAACTAFSLPARIDALTGWMLFFPLLDSTWRPSAVPCHARHILAWTALTLVAAALLVWQPHYISFVLLTVFITAVPEEWFFRAYFMTRLGAGVNANLVASLVFSVMHGLIWGWITAVLVFVPSLCYGWLYQRTRDLLLLVLVHVLSNLVYMLFLTNVIHGWLVR